MLCCNRSKISQPTRVRIHPNALTGRCVFRRKDLGIAEPVEEETVDIRKLYVVEPTAISPLTGRMKTEREVLSDLADNYRTVLESNDPRVKKQSGNMDALAVHHASSIQKVIEAKTKQQYDHREFGIIINEVLRENRPQVYEAIERSISRISLNDIIIKKLSEAIQERISAGNNAGVLENNNARAIFRNALTVYDILAKNISIADHSDEVNGTELQKALEVMVHKYIGAGRTYIQEGMKPSDMSDSYCRNDFLRWLEDQKGTTGDALEKCILKNLNRWFLSKKEKEIVHLVAEQMHLKLRVMLFEVFSHTRVDYDKEQIMIGHVKNYNILEQAKTYLKNYKGNVHQREKIEKELATYKRLSLAKADIEKQNAIFKKQMEERIEARHRGITYSMWQKRRAQQNGESNYKVEIPGGICPSKGAAILPAIKPVRNRPSELCEGETPCAYPKLGPKSTNRVLPVNFSNKQGQEISPKLPPIKMVMAH